MKSAAAFPLGSAVLPVDEGRLNVVENLLRQHLAERSLSRPAGVTATQSSKVSLSSPLNIVKKSQPAALVGSPTSFKQDPRYCVQAPSELASAYDPASTSPNSATKKQFHDMDGDKKGKEDKLNSTSTLQLLEHSRSYPVDQKLNGKHNTDHGFEKRGSHFVVVKDTRNLLDDLPRETVEAAKHTASFSYSDRELNKQFYLSNSIPKTSSRSQELDPASLEISLLHLEEALFGAMGEIEKLRQLVTFNQKRIMELETQLKNQKTEFTKQMSQTVYRTTATHPDAKCLTIGPENMGIPMSKQTSYHVLEAFRDKPCPQEEEEETPVYVPPISVTGTRDVSLGVRSTI